MVGIDNILLSEDNDNKLVIKIKCLPSENIINGEIVDIETKKIRLSYAADKSEKTLCQVHSTIEKLKQ